VVVRELQTAGDLAHQVGDVRRRHRTARTADRAGQRGAVEIVEHQEPRAAGQRADIVDLHEVAMRKPRGVDKPPDRQRVLRHPWNHDLHRAAGLEHRVLGQIRRAAVPEHAHDRERPELRADHRRPARSRASVVTQPHAHCSHPSERPIPSSSSIAKDLYHRIACNLRI